MCSLNNVTKFWFKLKHILFFFLLFLFWGVGGSRNGLSTSMSVFPNTQQSALYTNSLGGCRLFSVQPRLIIVLTASPELCSLIATRTRLMWLDGLIYEQGLVCMCELRPIVSIVFIASPQKPWKHHTRTPSHGLAVISQPKPASWLGAGKRFLTLMQCGPGRVTDAFCLT